MPRNTMTLVHPGFGERRAVRPRVRLMTRMVAACLGSRGQWVRLSRVVGERQPRHADVLASMLFLQDHAVIDYRMLRSGWEIRLHSEDSAYQDLR